MKRTRNARIGAPSGKVTSSSKKTKTMEYSGLEQIISGGQTGADRGGLEAGKQLGIKTGGTAPKDYMTENGPDPSLKKFHLIEGGGGYKDRTKKNVDDANGTLVFSLHPGSGTDRTVGWCIKRVWTDGGSNRENFIATCSNGWRPVFVVKDLTITEDIKKEIQSWIKENKIRILNIAGHRETTAGVDDFCNKVKQFLVEILAGTELGSDL